VVLYLRYQCLRFLCSKVGRSANNELGIYMNGSSCGLIEVRLWNFPGDNEGTHKTSELLVSPLTFKVHNF